MSVLRTQLTGVARRPARLLLTGLAVLVVSFVVFATVLAQRITERNLLDGLSGTPAAVDLVVRDGTVTTGELDTIKKIDGVAEAAGQVGAGAEVGREFLQIDGDSGTGPLAAATLASGRYPAKPGEIAVTPRTVDRLGLKVGTDVRATIGNKIVPLKVVGTVTADGDHGYQAYAPQPLVSALTGGDVLDEIDLRLRPGADASAVRSRVEAAVAAGTRVRSGDDVRHEEAEQQASQLDSVFAVIAMFVAVAVVAAGLVATSTFRIVFAQRLKQLALLRAVGAGRRAITGSLAAEGALTGLATGVAGVLLALGAGHLVPVVVRAYGVNLASPGFPIPAALGVVALAVLITTIAVLAPAASASRVSPLEALRSSSVTGARSDIGKARATLGILLVLGAGLAAAYVAMNVPGRDPENYNALPFLLATVVSGALAFFALIALGPVLIRPVLAVLGRPFRISPVGRLAAGGVGGAPRRAAAVSVVVALGVTLIAGALVGGASIRVLADRNEAKYAPADYEVTPIDDKPVPAALVEQLKSRPQLAHVTPYRRLDVKIGETELNANDLAMTTLPELSKVDVTAGSIADLAPGQMIISGFTSDNTGLKLGDQTELTHGKSRVRLRVTAVLPDTAPLGSAMVLDPADLTRLGAPATYSGVLADAATTGEKARTAGRTAIDQVQNAAGGGWKIDVLADQRDQIDGLITILLVIALGLVSLTVLVAVVGVGTTTALSVVERVREAGLLRAVGLSRGGLRTMLTAESALYGVIGAGLGLVLGIPYAWLAVKALGVNAPLTLPIGQLAVVFVVLVGLTALAGVWPSRRAAKVSPVVALATE
ncbi:FtsX-like permease family protein [Actinoplanes sp. TBRC 11911]|uniref:ABC transporter permease n=1 Tax=Actinoplanes sp. TBRC 11911 TaxID=2729386 RepID=UPI00145CF7D3|nr:FtsX-like permease family protein [Actinoplanes sp. TBRC 11911]NMO53570.1 FtsX-like permease family protein [Actinoplanes sp. TBRC 11911]